MQPLIRTQKQKNANIHKMEDASVVNLESSDGTLVIVQRQTAECFGIAKTLLDDLGDNDIASIPLPNVTEKILNLAVNFCTYHLAHPDQVSKVDAREPNQLCDFDREFFQIDTATLFELILAANYLDYTLLLDTTCSVVAGMLRGKTTEQLRQTFNIKNDFTPEEEAAVQKENEWCQDLD